MRRRNGHKGSKSIFQEVFLPLRGSASRYKLAALFFIWLYPATANHHKNEPASLWRRNARQSGSMSPEEAQKQVVHNIPSSEDASADNEASFSIFPQKSWQLHNFATASQNSSVLHDIQLLFDSLNFAHGGSHAVQFDRKATTDHSFDEEWAEPQKQLRKNCL